MFNKTILCVVVVSALQMVQAGEPISLLDKDLSKFEIWIGSPHSTVEGLPEGTYQSDKVTRGKPMGLNADVKNVFSVIEENGEPVLYITGEIYGGLTTLQEYENYHLSMQFKWGEKKWEPRLNDKRDSGILYHAYGAHGRFWNVWKTSLEYQVQETDLGDFISIGGNTGKPKVGGPATDIRGDGNADPKKYDPASDQYFSGKGYIHAASEPDSPHGEWNTLELYVIGNDAVHLVNGEVVMVVENARKPDGTPLVNGQIQIQSEAAECFYKDMVLTPITDFPASIKENVRFK